MPRLLGSTALSCAVLVLLSCGEKKPVPEPPRIHLALLGKNSPDVIAHFESTCPGRHNRTESLLSCHLPNRDTYSLVLDPKHERIGRLEISGTLADALQIYDRAFAPIVPEETREVLRASLLDPRQGDVFRKPGAAIRMYVGDVSRARAGEPVLFSWTMVDPYIDKPPLP
jgi:hypothetical protein